MLTRKKSKPVLSLSARSGTHLFGFPASWETTVIDSDGRVAYPNIPERGWGHVYERGEAFVECEGFDPDYFTEAEDKLKWLSEAFGYAARVDDLYIVSEDGEKFAFALDEWRTRNSRMPPATIDGLRLTLGSREGVAIVSAEPEAFRPDMAAYIDAVVAKVERTDPSQKYFWDGWYANLRSASTMDGDYLAEFAHTCYMDAGIPVVTAHDREIVRMGGVA